MTLEAAQDGLRGSTADELCSWPSDAVVCFEAFRAAFRAWHESTTAMDWVQHNEYAVTLLSASNLLPCDVTFTSDNSIDTEDSSSFPRVASSSPALLGLMVQAPCCGVSTTLSVDEQLTLAQLPRVFPFPTNSHQAIAVRNTTTGQGATFVTDDYSAALTVLERQQRIVVGLLTRAHRNHCLWRDPVATDPVEGERCREVSCTARQLLLGGPSLCVTDSTLVRTFCAAVIVRAASAASTANNDGVKNTSVRGRCLLPRGAPPSEVRRWMEETACTLQSSASATSTSNDFSGTDSLRDRLPHLRYTGSNTNQRILQLFFAPKKRVRPDSGATAAGGSPADAHAEADMSEGVIMEYMSLLMALYGYTTTAVNVAPQNNSSADGEELRDKSDNEEAPAPTSSATTAASSAATNTAATTWDGPPVLVDSSESQEGNRTTCVEVVKQHRSLPAFNAAEMLGRRISCRYCARAPWVTVQQEDVTTTTTTTTKTMVVTTVADPMSSVNPDAIVEVPDNRREASSGRQSTSQSDDSKGFVEAEGVDSLSPSNVDESEAHSEEPHGEEQYHDALPEEEHAAEEPVPDPGVGHASEVEERGGDAEDDTQSAVRACPRTAAEVDDVTPLTMTKKEHVEGGEKEAVNFTSASGASGAAESDEEAVQAAPAAITTVTRAVTTITTMRRTVSTTTITATFSRRDTAPYEPGHDRCCPWQRLFLTDTIDATALATAARCMDFTFVVDESAEETPNDGDTTSGQESIAESGEDCCERRTPAASALQVEDQTACAASSQAELEVAGTAMTLLQPLAPEHAAPCVEEGVTGEGDCQPSGDAEMNEVTHRTVLVLRFFLSEVERLITSWRLSEEWERTRPGQYLQHPLWHTWSAASVLHPIHTDAADGAMEQYLRVLEKRLAPAQARTHTVDNGGDHDDDDRACDTASQKVVAVLKSRQDVLDTVGAPLYQPSPAMVNKTAESTLRVASEALQRYFASMGNSGTHNLSHTSNERSTALSLLKSGLHSLLGAAERTSTRAGDTGERYDGKEAAGQEDVPTTRGAEAAALTTSEILLTEGSAKNAFLAAMQRRYGDDIDALKESPALQLRSALLHDALPYVLYPFVAPHYCQVHAGEPVHTIERSSTAVAMDDVATPLSTSALHLMSSSDRTNVEQYLQRMRETSQEEQMQLQRENEAEAQRVAAAAAVAAQQAQAQAQAQNHSAPPPTGVSKTAGGVVRGVQRSTPRPAPAAPFHTHPLPHSQQQQQQQQHQQHGGAVGVNQKGGPAPTPYRSGASSHSTAGVNVPLQQHPHGTGGDRWNSNFQNPSFANAGPALLPGAWGGMVAFPSAPSTPSPPVLFAGNPAEATNAAGKCLHASQPVFAQGGEGSSAVPDDNGAVLSSGFPFGWSPLASGPEEPSVGGGSGGGGSHIADGGGVLSFGGGGSVPNSYHASSPQAAPPVLFGGFNGNDRAGGAQDGAPYGVTSSISGGARLSDGRNPRSTGVLTGSGNTSYTSVLSSSGGGAEEVRLSNWSVQSNPTPSSSSGGVLLAGNVGVLSRNTGGGDYSGDSSAQGRGGASGGGVGVMQHRGGGGRSKGQSSNAGGVQSSSSNSAAGRGTNANTPSNAGRAVLGSGAGGSTTGAAVALSGGRGGRGRGRGNPPRRGGGGGGGRSSYRRGGG
jgi:hypothetical protein